MPQAPKIFQRNAKGKIKHRAGMRLVEGAAATYQTPVIGDLNSDGFGVFQATGGDFVPVF